MNGTMRLDPRYDSLNREAEMLNYYQRQDHSEERYRGNMYPAHAYLPQQQMYEREYYEQRMHK